MSYRYKVSDYNEGVKEFELIFDCDEYAKVAIGIIEDLKNTNPCVYECAEVEVDDDDYRVYVVCDIYTLYSVLDEVNFGLQIKSNSSNIDWEWA